MALSGGDLTAISLLGLLMPSVDVPIGAMLLPRLMMPIIAWASTSPRSISREIGRAAAGAANALVLSFVLVSISPVQTVTSEIVGRTQPTLFDLLVAFLDTVEADAAHRKPQ